MRTLLTVGISIALAITLLFALRDYMPGALLILGGAAFVAVYVARSVSEDPRHGWPRLAFFSAAGFVLTSFFTVVGGVQAWRVGWLLPVGAVFFLGLAIYSVVAWARLGRTTTSASGGQRFDSVAAAHDQSRAAELDRRRSDARAELNQARLETVQTDQRIRDLEAVNAALSRKVASLERDLDAAVNDPCFDQASHPLYKHV